MRDFDLVSVDWDTVRLLQAGQFKQETYYTEELVRWALYCGRIHGVLDLVEDGIGQPVPQGGTVFSVSVRGCRAVTEAGHIIDIPNEVYGAVAGIIEARSAIVPLYVGVSITERAREPELRPSFDTGLMRCGGIRPSYVLSIDNIDETVDWLQIAQFRMETTGLQPDRSYVPECMFLSSHERLAYYRQEITTRARTVLDTLRTYSSDSMAVTAVAMALAGSLGSAAKSVDDGQHPRAYVDRLAGVLTSQYIQLQTFPPPKLALFQQTLNMLEQTLTYLETSWTLGQALAYIVERFDQLLQLYPELMEYLAGIGPAQPGVVSKIQATMPAAPPGKADHAPVRPKQGPGWLR
jgi:hypothetical protein